jgi:hypothetical protein
MVEEHSPTYSTYLASSMILTGIRKRELKNASADRITANYCIDISRDCLGNLGALANTSIKVQ